MRPISKSAIVMVVASMALAACGGSKTNPTDPGYIGQQGPNAGGDMPGGSILGDRNLIFGTGKSRPGENAQGCGGAGTGGASLGVNAYLWRGALDTLSFMPL